jgi:sulfite dehydrogenase (cytochrome) subunit B
MRAGVFVMIVAFACAGVSAADAEQKPVVLMPGPGLDKVEGNCGACHSLDYIPMNSPFLDAAGWNAEVTKMIEAFGAPIADADAKAIVDYLTKNYGTHP